MVSIYYDVRKAKLLGRIFFRFFSFFAKNQNAKKMEAIPKTQFQNKTACKIMACFLKTSASLVLKFQALPFIGGWFWVSEFLLDIFEKSLVFYNSYFTLWLLTIQFFCTLWLFDKYKMQDPVQKSVVFPERVKSLSCLVTRIVGLIAGGTAAQVYVIYTHWFQIWNIEPIPMFILASYVSLGWNSAISRPVHPGPGHDFSKEHLLSAPLY